MAPPRIFTLAEARALVPVLRPRLREMARIRERLLPFREQVERLAEGAQRGGGTFPAAGEYLRHVQELLAHSQVATTAIYTKAQVDDSKEVVRKKHPGERRCRKKK